MYSHVRSVLYLSLVVVLPQTVSSAPTQPISLGLPSTSAGPLNTIVSSLNKSTEAIPDQWLPLTPLKNNLTTNPPQLKFTTVTWPITPTLSLIANIGPWRLNPTNILATLSAANKTVEKKPAGLLLDRKFRQETGSRINTLYFEIGPAFEVKRLTWGDVAEVLSEKGLPKFFEEYGYWTSTYFEVMDGVRGKLGEGAVRKWYQLEPADDGDGGGDVTVV